IYTRLGSHLPWGDPRRGWDFVSFGRGEVPWDAAFRALRSIGYEGPISIEWEDAGVDRLHGAKEALEVLRSLDYPVSEVSFDAASSNQGRDARQPRPARRAGGPRPDLPHPRAGRTHDPSRLGRGGPPRAPGGARTLTAPRDRGVAARSARAPCRGGPGGVAGAVLDGQGRVLPRRPRPPLPRRDGRPAQRAGGAAHPSRGPPPRSARMGTAQAPARDLRGRLAGGRPDGAAGDVGARRGHPGLPARRQAAALPATCGQPADPRGAARTAAVGQRTRRGRARPRRRRRGRAAGAAGGTRRTVTPGGR